ncbi:P-loop containing nucleoside triphosphate hydrolase protein, partial [Pavlovales sp. CCMP2436]
DWLYVILDEGHKIRNPQAEVSLACKTFATGHRLILSGSPIQNNLTELWSLLDFCFPGKLGALPVFTMQFAVPIARGSYTNASEFDVQAAYQCSLVLRDLIAPYLLRRLKSEVAAGRALPPKSEHVLFCGLTHAQTELYERFLSGDVVSATLSGRTKAFAALIALQKICNHPHLFSYTPPAGKRPARTSNSSNKSKSTGRSACDNYGDPALAGKLRVLQQVLEAWHSEGHRVLLFTQTRQMLDVLQIKKKKKKKKKKSLDGSTAVGTRLALIDEFNRDESIFLFLLTTRAGGLGINLTGADRVVLYDPDWNPANDAQARERAWRIGQLRAVTVYRLVSVGTVEEKVFHRQVYKQLLSNKILKDPKQRRLFKQRDLKDLFARPPPVSSRTPALARAESEAAATAAASVEAAGMAAMGGGGAVQRFSDQFTERRMGARDGAEEDGGVGGGASVGGSNAGGARETGLLRSLLDGSGVSSAVNHDHVIGDELSARLTREEAGKVAQRAAALLRASGSEVRGGCDPEFAAGLAPRPAVPRFGRAGGMGGAAPPRAGAGTAAPTAGAGSGAAGAAGGLSSGALLAQIRSRQREVEDAATGLARQPESIAALGAARLATSADGQAAEMLSKLRSHFARSGGRSTTAQIIGAFERQCEVRNIGKLLFRELLRQVAVQHSSEWRLKS